MRERQHIPVFHKGFKSLASDPGERKAKNLRSLRFFTVLS